VWWAFYDVAIFSNGMVFASAEVSNAAGGSSGSKIYSPLQVGSTTAAVIFTLDAFGAANGGWWRLSLDRATLVHTAAYSDSEMVGGGKTYTMTPDKCLVNMF
jgi:hypothetical protein